MEEGTRRRKGSREERGTGGVAAVGSRSLSALPTCSGPLVIGYYFLIIIIFYVCNGQSQVIKE